MMNYFLPTKMLIGIYVVIAAFVPACEAFGAFKKGKELELGTEGTELGTEGTEPSYIKAAQDNKFCDSVEQHKVQHELYRSKANEYNLAACKELCDSQSSCVAITYFSDDGCRTYSSCLSTQTVDNPYSVTTEIFVAASWNPCACGTFDVNSLMCIAPVQSSPSSFCGTGTTFDTGVNKCIAPIAPVGSNNLDGYNPCNADNAYCANAYCGDCLDANADDCADYGAGAADCYAAACGYNDNRNANCYDCLDAAAAYCGDANAYYYGDYYCYRAYYAAYCGGRRLEADDQKTLDLVKHGTLQTSA